MREANEVEAWLKKAEADFAGALHLHRRRKKAAAGFSLLSLSAGSREVFESFLIYKEVPFAKTHDLLALLELCTDQQPEFALHSESFEVLNPYSVQFRYPGEEATVEEARLAIKMIKNIAIFMRRHFPSGLLPSSET